MPASAFARKTFPNDRSAATLQIFGGRMSLRLTLMRLFRSRKAVEEVDAGTIPAEGADSETTECCETGDADRDYYVRRAQEERAAADKASSGAARKSHLELAAVYELLAGSEKH